MEDRFERFSVGMSEISRYWHKLTGDEMEKYGLKGTHSIYLLTMYRFPEGLTAPRLCELCVKDKADVSRMMSLMEKKGLVRKESVGKTLYGGVFKLTEEGQVLFEHTRAAFEQLSIGEQELKRIREFLQENGIYHGI